MQLTGPIVSTQWLAEHLDDATLRIFDVSIFLTPNDPDPGYTIVGGRSAWEENHIPGSNFLDLLTDFSDQSAPLPLTMLTPEVFAERAGQAGIGDDTAVVIYGADSMMFSTRMWWMLRTIGFNNVAVLDGGWNKWQNERRPTNSAVANYSPSSLSPTPLPHLWASKTDVVNAMQDKSVCTLNALAPEVYNGEVTRYGRPGHIPGSHNIFYNSLLDPDTGTFLPLDKLRERFEASGVLQKPRAIVYCGGGISATMDALALTMLEHPHISLYDGSMSEWTQDPALPLVCGDTP